jgi:hypothetical protein
MTPHDKKMHGKEIYIYSEIFRHKTSHMVLSIIFLEDKHKILLHLSIFYEYQQFFQHRICFSIQPQLQLVSDFYVNLRVEVAAVSRNRYGVEKTVDTHKILINAIKCYDAESVCFKSVIQLGRSLFLSKIQMHC